MPVFGLSKDTWVAIFKLAIIVYFAIIFLMLMVGRWMNHRRTQESQQEEHEYRGMWP